MSSAQTNRIVQTEYGPVVCEANPEGLVMVRTPEALNGRGTDPKALEPLDGGGQRYRISFFVNADTNEIVGHHSISRVNLDDPWSVNNEPPTTKQREKILALVKTTAKEWATKNRLALLEGKKKGATHRRSNIVRKVAELKEQLAAAESELADADATLDSLTDQIENLAEA
tara:strand:+ start:183999 stop:184511 length:513 start_codon:yes stop_codon:yes gene_type:complete